MVGWHHRLDGPLEQLFLLFYNFPTTAGQMQQKTLNISPFPPVQGASQVALVVKNLPASAGDIRDTGSIPGSGRSPGGGHCSPLQYSCLENPMDREACVHEVTESWTQLKRLSIHTHTHTLTGTKLLYPFVTLILPCALYPDLCF